MEKEAYVSIHSEGAELAPDIHELVIMDPDEVIGAGIVRYNLREAAVYPLICIPVAWRKIAVGLQIMEERPDDFVGKAVIEIIAIRGAEGHGL